MEWVNPNLTGMDFQGKCKVRDNKMKCPAKKWKTLNDTLDPVVGHVKKMRSPVAHCLPSTLSKLSSLPDPCFRPAACFDEGLSSKNKSHAVLKFKSVNVKQ